MFFHRFQKLKYVFVSSALHFRVDQVVFFRPKVSDGDGCLGEDRPLVVAAPFSDSSKQGTVHLFPFCSFLFSKT